MIGLGTIGKLFKSGMGPDEICELLGGMGIEVAISEIPQEHCIDAWNFMATQAVETGARSTMVKGQLKTGEKFAGIIVVNTDQTPLALRG